MAVTVGSPLRAVPILVISSLGLTVNEVVIREAKSRSLEVTLLAIGFEMVLCHRPTTVASAVVEELCRTSTTVRIRLGRLIGLTRRALLSCLAAAYLELGLLV